MDRLFPGVEIKHDHPSEDASLTDSGITLPKDSNADNFITCTIMGMKPMSVVENDKQNRIYFRSETAVKGDNYGWIMWTHISTLPEKENEKYKNSFNFIYMMMFLKKTEAKWEVDGGILWDHYVQAGHFENEKFVIAPPQEKEGWFTPDKPRGYKDQTPFQEKSWVGIGEVDRDKDSKEKDLLQSMSIYTNESQYAEFWGNNGEFLGNTGQGYTFIQRFYKKGEGWKKMKGTSYENFSSQLKDWYKPFKDKKIKWSNLRDRCDAWSRIRSKQITSGEEDLRALCYSASSK